MASLQQKLLQMSREKTREGATYGLQPPYSSGIS